MKQLICILAVILLVSCNKEDVSPEVTFSLNISGFNITTDDFGTLKGTSVFSDFVHQYAGGTINIAAPSGAVYTFNTGSISLDGFAITVPVGTYIISGATPPAFPPGREVMAFTIEEQEVVITKNTTSININITPTCGLIVVADPLELLESAQMIQASGQKWDLPQIDGYYFRYFLPNTNATPSNHRIRAELIKKDGSILTMYTENLKVGYI